LGLSSGEVPGNPLDLLFSGVVLYSSTIGNSAADHLCVYLPGTEQATPPCGHSEPSESELLGSELLLYGSKVTLPLEFTVDLDAQKLGLLDRGNYLLVEVDQCRRSCVAGTELYCKTPESLQYKKESLPPSTLPPRAQDCCPEAHHIVT
jgi:hypothetical protein